MEQYEKLLEEAYKNVKQVSHNGERFEIPKVEGHVEGKKTIITNFSQIVSYFRRNQEHFLKFLLRELATPGQIEGDRLILNRVLQSSKINEKIEEYAKEFVICKECGKPDTELTKDQQSRITFINCLACGAKHSVRSKI
jgi:translation initiation factor 2 subunit 2